jgi:hypothetical protein
MGGSPFDIFKIKGGVQETDSFGDGILKLFGAKNQDKQDVV